MIHLTDEAGRKWSVDSVGEAIQLAIALSEWKATPAGKRIAMSPPAPDGAFVATNAVNTNVEGGTVTGRGR